MFKLLILFLLNLNIYSNLITLQIIDNQNEKKIIGFFDQKKLSKNISEQCKDKTKLIKVSKKLLNDETLEKEFIWTIPTIGKVRKTIKIINTCDSNFNLPDDFINSINLINSVIPTEVYDTLSNNIYQADLTSCFPTFIKDLIQTEGLDRANCFNSILYGLKLTDKTEFMSQKQFIQFLNKKNVILLEHPKSGSFGVMFYKGKPIHAFWVIEKNEIVQINFTKNGAGKRRPYRFQNHEYMKETYHYSKIRYFKYLH